MKITRVIDGKNIEIELTHCEMVQAAEFIREYDYAQFMKKQIQALDDDDDRAALKHMDEKTVTDAIDSMLINFQVLVEEYDYDWCDAWVQVSNDYVAKLDSTSANSNKEELT